MSTAECTLGKHYTRAVREKENKRKCEGGWDGRKRSGEWLGKEGPTRAFIIQSAQGRIFDAMITAAAHAYPSKVAEEVHALRVMLYLS